MERGKIWKKWWLKRRGICLILLAAPVFTFFVFGIRLMKEINYRVSEWITLGFVESFVMQDRIAGDINNYHDKIEALKEKYKVMSFE